MPTSRPRNHESSRSAPKIPKKAPMSIMPSRPTFTTPLRSETMPPSAREDQRRGEAQGRRDQRRPRDDVLEVAGARLRGRHGAGAADEAGRDRAPAQAALLAARSPSRRRSSPAAPMRIEGTGVRTSAGGQRDEPRRRSPARCRPSRRGAHRTRAPATRWRRRCSRGLRLLGRRRRGRRPAVVGRSRARGAASSARSRRR